MNSRVACRCGVCGTVVSKTLEYDGDFFICPECHGKVVPCANCLITLLPPQDSVPSECPNCCFVTNVSLDKDTVYKIMPHLQSLIDLKEYSNKICSEFHAATSGEEGQYNIHKLLRELACIHGYYCSTQTIFCQQGFTSDQSSLQEILRNQETQTHLSKSIERFLRQLPRIVHHKRHLYQSLSCLKFGQRAEQHRGNIIAERFLHRAYQSTQRQYQNVVKPQLHVLKRINRELKHSLVHNVVEREKALLSTYLLDSEQTIEKKINRDGNEADMKRVFQVIWRHVAT